MERRAIFGQWPVLALNLDEVRESKIIPPSFLKTEKWVEGRGWTTDRDDSWTVQGNDLARWTIEASNSQ